MPATRPRWIVRRAVMALAGVLLLAILVKDVASLQQSGPFCPGGVCVLFRGGARVEMLYESNNRWYRARLAHYSNEGGGIGAIVAVGFSKTFWCAIGNDVFWFDVGPDHAITIRRE